MSALAPGLVVGHRYRLTHRIAVGGMGEVWEAADLRLGRAVAIKVLRSELGGDGEFADRFRVEARTTASLNHRNIAAVHDYGEDGAVAYLVMELVHGEPLSTRLATRGRLGPVPTLELLEQAGRALQAAHARGFVHRDVKPGNILLADDGTVKLTDFGIAKAANSAGVTSTGMVMGTAYYIAPEQARGEQAGPASDVYSLGVVGYECLAGHRPFRAASTVAVAMMHINDPLPPLPGDIPSGIRRLVEFALVKDPVQRYADGTEFVAAVTTVRRGQPAPRPGSLDPAAAEALTARAPHDPGPSSDGLAVAGPAGPGLPGMTTGPRSRPVSTSGRRSGPSLMTWAFVLLTMAAVVVGVIVVRKALTPAPPVAGPAAPPGSVQVTPPELTGRPATSVGYTLQSSGLRVQVRDTRGAPPTAPSTCSVTDVTPSGSVPQGAEVIVTCEQH